MFTGIIETLGTIQEIKKDKDNIHITIASSLTDELQIDQSVAHNGICMTVVAIDKESIITKPENEKEISHGNEQ